MDSIPSLKDLYQYVTALHATKWKVIGRKLGLPYEQLVEIETKYPTNVKRCCNQMLGNWLDIDTNASWRKLLKVIESTAVSSTSDKGDYCIHCSYIICVSKYHINKLMFTIITTAVNLLLQKLL